MTWKNRPRRLSLALLVTLAGCYETPKPSCAFTCGAGAACPDEYSCGADNRCHLVLGDGSLAACTDSLPPDAATADAPTADAATLDAATLDAATLDAATLDAATADAAAFDAAADATIVVDAATPDAFTADAVPPDAFTADAVPPDAFTADAVPPDANLVPDASGLVCGDGVVGPGEDCDDHNTADDGNGCSTDCHRLGSCGNSTVESLFEACDDGNTADDGNGCSTSCARLGSCGDGSTQTYFEACDDGNQLDDGNGCSAACARLGSCGDGTTQSIFEDCDDGNQLDDGNGCSTICGQNNTCGDLTVEAIFEDCDDGNTADDGNGCSAGCLRLGSCGDAALEAYFEECDDGNPVPGDGCTACLIDAGWTCAGASCVNHRLTMTVDGVREALWDAPGVTSFGASLGQSRLPGDQIGTVLLATDATYLYIAVEGFVDPWDDGKSAHLNAYLTPDPTSEGAVAADDWQPQTTFAAGSRRPHAIAHFFSKRPYDVLSGPGGVADQGADNATNFAELRVPLASFGSPGPGDFIGVLVGFRPDETKIGLSDAAPYRAGIVSDYGNSPSAVDPATGDYIVHAIY